MESRVGAADNLRAIGEGIARLGNICPVRLPPGSQLRVVSAAQAALLDFLAEHPFCRITDLEIVNGEPHLVRLKLNDAVEQTIKLSRSGAASK